MSSKAKLYFKTFGCRTNQFDTQVMMSRVGPHTIVQSEEEADVIVINSCTVTNGADAGVRSYINQVRRKNSHARLLLTGCGVYTKGERLLQEQKIDGVFGHSEKERIGEYLFRKEPFCDIGDLEHIDTTVVEQFVGKSRAFIKIQEGCDFHCSYCIIPYVRGRARSLAQSQILEQVERLAANGFGEFVLTGTNVGSYGIDSQTSLADLLQKMSQIRGVRRIRIGSLEPIQVTDALMELMNEPWMARHLHIALQHTSDKMLEWMQRRNRYKQDRALLERLSDQGYALGTDFIVGHPGEDATIWQEAFERFKALPLTHLHAFTYSVRDGTPSATMGPPVPGDIAKQRHKQITSWVKENNHRFRQRCQLPLQVLVENYKEREGVWTGLDQYFNKVAIQSDRDLEGMWVTIETFEPHKEGNRAVFA